MPYRLLVLLFIAPGAQTEHFRATASESPCPSALPHFLPKLELCGGLVNFTRRQKDTFEVAVKNCAASGDASLPSIRSWEENAAIRALVPHQLNVADIMLGLRCSEDGHWYWLNGEPWSGYTNFEQGGSEDPESCDFGANPVYHMTMDGRWIQHTHDKFVTPDAVLCTVRPAGFDATAVPAHPGIPFPCEPGWTLIYSICYFTDVTSSGLTWDEANTACIGMEATLPIVNNKWQNRRLSFDTLVSYDFRTRAQFWIGLVCESSGELSWQDGTPCDQQLFSLIDDNDGGNCTQPENGYYFSRISRWVSEAKSETAAFLVCSKPAAFAPSSTPASSTSALRTTTPDVTSPSPTSASTTGTTTTTLSTTADEQDERTTGTIVSTSTIILTAPTSTQKPSSDTVPMASTTVPETTTSAARRTGVIWAAVPSIFMVARHLTG